MGPFKIIFFAETAIIPTPTLKIQSKICHQQEMKRNSDWGYGSHVVICPHAIKTWSKNTKKKKTIKHLSATQTDYKKKNELSERVYYNLGL